MNWELQKLANNIKFDDISKEIDYQTSKKTLDTLIMYCDEENCSTFVSMEQIKQQIRCNSMQTVYNHFEKLQDLGILEVYKKGKFMMKKININPSNLSSNLSSSPIEAKVREEKVREDKGVFCESKDSLIVEPTSEPDQQIIDEVFNYCWDIHSNRLKQLTTKDGNPRKNGNKGKTKQRFVSLLKKYSMLVLSVYVKNSTFQTHPKEFINLIGRDIDKCLLDGLNNIEDDQLEEMLDKNYDKKSFLYIIEQIEEQI